MKTLLISLVVFFSFAAFAPHAHASEPPVVTVILAEGVPQYYSLEVMNAGTVRLQLDLNGHSLAELDDGQMIITKADGHSFKFRNMWDCEGEVCLWEQYVPYDVIGLAFENNLLATWVGYGYWVAYEGGLYKPMQITQIELEVLAPNYRDWNSEYDPTWDWMFKATPEWAAQQWFDQFDRTVSVDIVTSCDGLAGNHNAQFAWGPDLKPGTVFGNWVDSQWVREPLTKVQWTITGAGWYQTGSTTGPSCWKAKAFLPLV